MMSDRCTPDLGLSMGGGGRRREESTFTTSRGFGDETVTGTSRAKPFKADRRDTPYRLAVLEHVADRPVWDSGARLESDHTKCATPLLSLVVVNPHLTDLHVRDVFHATS